MAIADQSGYDAIQPPVPQAPYARRKIVRGPDGTPQVILVDMQGQTISDPTGYGILEPGNSIYINQNAKVESNNPKPVSEKSTAKQVVQETIGRGSDRASDSGPGDGNFGRNPSNNFGYINKPGMMGLAGALPGPAGLIGKGVNLGINANNVGATNAARSMLGMPGAGIGSNALGVVRDNRGQVADVSIGGSQYSTPIGLEALSPSGMTNMTPDEAAKRAAATGGIALSTPEQIAARDQAFEAEFGKPGLFSRMTNVANSFLDNMFGSNTYDPIKHAQIERQNTGSDFQPTQSGFMDMLSGSSDRSGSDSRSEGYAQRDTPSGTFGTSQSPGVGRSGLDSGGGRSLSPGASRAIDRGQGGLY